MSLTLHPSTEYSFVGNEYFQVQSSSSSSPMYLFGNNIPTTRPPKLSKPVVIINGVYDRIIADSNKNNDHNDVICIEETENNHHQRYCFQREFKVMHQYTQFGSFSWIHDIIQSFFREWRRFCFRRRYFFPLIRHAKKKA